MKLAGLHVFAHEGDQTHTEDCIVCDFTTVQSLAPIAPTLSQDVTFKNLEIIFINKPFTGYVTFRVNSITPDQLFSRPPPFVFS